MDDPSIIKEELSKQLKKHGMPQSMLPDLMRHSAPLLKTIMPDVVSQMPSGIEYLREIVPSKLQEASKSGHIKALTKSIAPEVKARRYEKLSYKIVDCTEPILPLETILGDRPRFSMKGAVPSNKRGLSPIFLIDQF